MLICRRSVWLIFALLLTVACAKTQTANSGAHANPNVTPWHVTPYPLPSVYQAIDYKNPGHPALTPSEVRLIRKTLAAVRPCQLRFLRYSFPNNSKGIVLYFGGAEAGDFPVLWVRNGYYRVDEGSVAPGSATTPGFDLRSDVHIKEFGCSPQP